MRSFRVRDAVTFLAALSITAGAGAQVSDDTVKIGVLGDMSGIYSNLSGKGAAEAVRMAVEDFGGSVLNKKIEVVVGDHTNKPDVAASVARRWFDEDHVDMITDLAGSASALAVIGIAQQKDRIAIVNSASASDISGAKCTPNSILYTIETSAIAHAMGDAMTKRGLDSWFIISADYAFGKALEKDLGEVVVKTGGKVVGVVRHPPGATDFSSFMLQAQASKAKVIALATAGADLVNAIKSAKEFGIAQDASQTLAGMLIFIGDIHALGLQTTQGLVFTTAFYWDQDDASRQWAQRFYKRVGQMPQMTHAGDYSSTMHYLKAVKAAGTDKASDVMKQMKAMPVDDFFSRGGRIREDGLLAHDLLLVQVKKPSESKAPWDYYNVLQKIPAAQAYRSVSESSCPLVRK